MGRKRVRKKSPGRKGRKRKRACKKGRRRRSGERGKKTVLPSLERRVYERLLKEPCSHIPKDDLEEMKNLQQRSRTWFQLRRMSFGASTVGALLHQSDWESGEEALNKFLHPSSPSPWLQAALNHGSKHEDVATALFKKIRGEVCEGRGHLGDDFPWHDEGTRIFHATFFTRRRFSTQACRDWVCDLPFEGGEVPMAAPES